MSVALEKYVLAVSRRKAISRNPTLKVNYAITSQLEEKDIPLLLEIIRVQDQALEKIASDAADDRDEKANVALRARIETETLASSGSDAEWGGGTHA